MLLKYRYSILKDFSGRRLQLVKETKMAENQEITV